MHKDIYRLEISSNTARLPVKAAELELLLGKAIKVLSACKGVKKKLKGGVIQLVFTNDKEIKLINAEYRGVNKPTDVISLSYIHEKKFPIKSDLAGEIIISLDTARRQAKEHVISLAREVKFLFAHGVLHVFGFDHLTEIEREIMFKLQDKILA
jgi:probable rRNA maturation factor